MNSFNTFREPLFQTPPFLTPRKNIDAEPNFTEDDRIDNDLPLVSVKPFNNATVGHRSCRLAENIGIDKVAHNVSVDSEGIGRK